MIEINEAFTVTAPPAEVYAVLSDPHAVVECVAGASLGESHEDGSFDGMMTVKFSALRVAFKGRVKLDLDEETRHGVVHAGAGQPGVRRGQDEGQREIDELREKIDAAGMPEDVKKEAMKELNRLGRMSPMAADYSLTRNYIEWLAVLPWSKTSSGVNTR